MLNQILKEKDGSKAINQDRILERCEQFFKELYEDPQQDILITPAKEKPLILKNEVEKEADQIFLNHLEKTSWR